MMPGSRHPRLRAFALLAFSVSALLPPVCAHAQGAPQIALSQAVQPAPQPVQATAPAAGTTGNAADADQAIPPPQRTLTAKAIDKVKQVAKSASDIFGRVPCLPPKGGVQPLGSLPHVANKLIAGKPVVIIAFGSSSTEGYGSSAPEFTYPNRL